MKVVIYNDKTKALSCTYRRGYSVSKRLVKLTGFNNFPLQLSGHQDKPPLSYVLHHQL